MINKKGFTLIELLIVVAIIGILFKLPIFYLLIQLKKYKKYNKISYKDGVKYMRKFFKTIHILEHDDIYNYNHYKHNYSFFIMPPKTGIFIATTQLPH